jgi:hypothetical protein
MTMSSPQASGASSPNPAGQLQDALTTFSDAVFEATQFLLNAQQQLTRALLNGSGAQTQADVDEEPTGGDEQETDGVAADEGGAEYAGDQNEATSGVADDEVDEIDDEADEADGVDEVDDEADETDDEVDEVDDEADEIDDEVDEADEADGEVDEVDDEADVEPATEQAEGDAPPTPAQAGGRPRRGRRPAQAGRMTSGVAT